MFPTAYSKIRLTGGEPLVRKDLPLLVKMLAEIPDLDLTLTTNGSLLEKQAQALKDAGLEPCLCQPGFAR